MAKQALWYRSPHHPARAPEAPGFFIGIPYR